jgi:hypothetical protein
VIKLKRARNSLLNISTRVPPEILGDVFVWSVARKEDHSLHTDSHFRGIRKGSYSFLLVCHHWFKVATSTPELWSFWGNTLREWKNRYPYPGVAPLDLVLYKHSSDHSSDRDVTVPEPLQDALRNRAMQGIIRQIHLSGTDLRILRPVILSLTPDGEGVQHSSIESIDLRPQRFTLDVSNFFARHRLPKLRSLFLHGTLRMPPWGRLVPHTTLLTTLSLAISGPPPTLPPTTSQLLSILVSNPNLQELVMTYSVIPADDDRSTFQVPIRHLKRLELTGELRPMFRLLDRLAFPGMLDRIFLSALDSTVEDVLQISGPYLRSYFQHDRRPQDELGVDICSINNRFSIDINTTGKSCLQTSSWNEPPPFWGFRMIPDEIIPSDVLDNLCLNFIVFTPQERVSRLHLITNAPANRMEDILIAMPNIETLRLSKVALSKRFLQPKPNGPHANTKLLPSLRYLDLCDIALPDGDWGHLTTYLAHQTSGGRLISLRASGRSRMRREVMSKIEGLVEAFSYHRDYGGEGGEGGAGGDHEESDGGKGAEGERSTGRSCNLR